jgi:hypothetical protein
MLQISLPPPQAFQFRSDDRVRARLMGLPPRQMRIEYPGPKIGKAMVTPLNNVLDLVMGSFFLACA